MNSQPPSTIFWPRHSPHFLAVRRAVRRFDGPAVVGLSGGADSLALVAAAKAEDKEITAVVVDHGLQQGSADVGSFAVEQVRCLGVSAQLTRVHVAPGNVEAEARKARYEALLAWGLPVWVAHTMDDQAETYLLNSLRGRGVGMAETNRVVRPLLGVRRIDTVGACKELGLAYWSDPMNVDKRFQRVRLRREVIPLLNQIKGFDVVPALAQAAEHGVLLESAFAVEASDMSVEKLQQLSPTELRMVIVRFLQGYSVTVDRAKLVAIENLVHHWHGQGGVAIGRRLEVVRKNGTLFVTPGERL
ncbi:tRNA lysidine(34) synthetase TilS [Corynebacterium kutscheri]|uniref:tRNA lysidine(34) synthetase TilS n=1 Tax=Corynebacterium kutscheri TaxID=35755 RepID=UPI0037BFFCF8